MKEKYIKKVKKSLSLPNKHKKEIIRDLEEIFSAAAENDETEKEVAARLGSPSDYVTNIEEQLRIDGSSKKRNKILLFYAITGVLSVLSLAIYFSAIASRPPENAIGFAQSSTNITIEGKINFIFLFLIIGVIALCTSLFGIFKIMKTRRKK